jgi:hypothetical protein
MVEWASTLGEQWGSGAKMLSGKRRMTWTGRGLARFASASLGICLLSGVATAASAACSVGQRVLAEPGDRAGTVTAFTGASCRVHFDDPSRQDDWVQVYSIKAAGSAAADRAVAGRGPRSGRYNITVGTGFYDGYLLIAGSGYELFLPGDRSAGSGQYSFDPLGPRIRWLSGPMTNPQWDGTQLMEASGSMLKIRVGQRAVATNSAR